MTMYRYGPEEQKRGPCTGTVLRRSDNDRYCPELQGRGPGKVMRKRGKDQVQVQSQGAGESTRYRYSLSLSFPLPAVFFSFFSYFSSFILGLVMGKIAIRLTLRASKDELQVCLAKLHIIEQWRVCHIHD